MSKRTSTTHDYNNLTEEDVRLSTSLHDVAAPGLGKGTGRKVFCYFCQHYVSEDNAIYGRVKLFVSEHCCRPCAELHHVVEVPLDDKWQTWNA